MCMAPPQLRGVVTSVEAVRKSAVMAGIVPDRRHLDSGGYHVCLRDLRKYGNFGDYSSSSALDRPPKVSKSGEGYSCAYDIGMSKPDMIKTHASVKKVHGDKTDPRRKYVNAINCWDGSGDAQRFNFQTGKVGYASPGHKTHVHGDAPRCYMDPDHPEHAKAARAHASILTGESRAEWTVREEPKPAGKPAVKPKPTTRLIRPGDTLGALARSTGVSVANLQRWNGLGASTIIYAGKTLRLTAPPSRAVVVVPKWPVKANAYFRPRENPPKYLTVGRWQKAMRDHGWTIGVDDYLGPRSGKVLVAFQRAEGLKVTGVLDKSTFVRAFTTKRRGK
jgi:LysM repeat protein